MESKHASEYIIRKTSYCLVKLLHRGIEIVPRNLDPVFCSFELCLQIPEILGCLEVWICFGYSKQSTQRTTQSGLCLLEFSEVFRSKFVGIDLHLGRFGPGFYD